MLTYGTIKDWGGWADCLTRWNHLMLVINSSSNIVIYVAKVTLNHSPIKFRTKQSDICVWQDFKFRQALYDSLTCQLGEGRNSQPGTRR